MAHDASELQVAAKLGDLDTVKAIVAKNPKAVHAKGGSDKHTALHSAAEKGLTDMMSFLLSHGAHVKVHDKFGLTPLHYAASEGHSEAIELLIEHGSDTEAKDEWGQTPLHRAADRGQVEAAAALLRHGAHRAAHDKAGSPLRTKGKTPGQLSDHAHDTIRQAIALNKEGSSAGDAHDHDDHHQPPPS